jgi:hypothetical protein
MTRACEEQSIVDQAIENSDTATGSLNECHVSQSDTTLSLSPIGNDYQLLTHLARRHNLKIKYVPGDGNCFFHAVSFCLRAAGIQVISGPDIRAALIQYFQTTDEKRHYMGFLEFDDTTFNNALSTEEQQLQEFELYVNRLRNGEWADNLAVQGVVDMLNINIRVINTITPNWIHQIQPRQQTTDNTITLGQMGELHYVALENVQEIIRNESRFEEATNQIEDEEDIIAYEQTSKLRGIPYDTLLQDEQQLVNDDSTYSIAPGENQTPCAFLMDEQFEELANPSKYPYGRGGLSTKRQRKITARKYFNQRLLHKDGRFASDIDYLLAAQYTVEAKQVRDDMQITLRQTRGQTFQNRTVNAGLVKSSDNLQAMIRTDTAFKFLKNVRGSPAHWKTVLLDLLAMVRQLGMPTWFLTLSAADMQWPEVIQSIAHQYGKVLTADDAKNMPWVESANGYVPTQSQHPVNSNIAWINSSKSS